MQEENNVRDEVISGRDLGELIQKMDNFLFELQEKCIFTAFIAKDFIVKLGFLTQERGQWKQWVEVEEIPFQEKDGWQCAGLEYNITTEASLEAMRDLSNETREFLEKRGQKIVCWGEPRLEVELGHPWWFRPYIFQEPDSTMVCQEKWLEKGNGEFVVIERTPKEIVMFVPEFAEAA